MPEILYGLHSHKEQGFFAFHLPKPAAEQTLSALGFLPASGDTWIHPGTKDQATLYKMDAIALALCGDAEGG